MATSLRTEQPVGEENFPRANKNKIGIVVSDWNSEITGKLYGCAVETLLKHGVKNENIETLRVPGSFELIAGARMLARHSNIDAVICLGCVIQGDTPHFEYVCQGVASGLAQLNVKHDIAFVFGVLTTNNLEQAQDRAGGKLGNKGEEAAITALKMASLTWKIKK